MAFSACREKEIVITLPETRLFSEENQFVLVVSDYARLYKEADERSTIHFYARKKDVFQVISSSPNNGWIEVRTEEGRKWISAEKVEIFRGNAGDTSARITNP